MTTTITNIIFGLLLILLIVSCRPIRVFENSNAPVYFKDEHSYMHSDNTVSLVSYNLKTGSDPIKAVQEFMKHPLLSASKIILLQEVDEHVVSTFADSLKMNYVYYPISRSKQGINFGNAILARYSIESHSKLILPHNKINGRIRNATNCELNIEGKNVLLYSIHNETIVLSRKKRQEQLTAIYKDIKERDKRPDAIIMGGDFNYYSQKVLQNNMRQFLDDGFEWATKEIGTSTSKVFGMIKLSLDHVFIKHGKVYATFIFDNIDSSDHYPLYLELEVI